MDNGQQALRFVRLKNAILETLKAEEHISLFMGHLADGIAIHTDDLLMGTLSGGKRTFMLRSALMATAEELAKSPKTASLARIIWNPIVAASLDIEASNASDVTEKPVAAKITSRRKSKPKPVEVSPFPVLTTDGLADVYKHLQQLCLEQNPYSSKKTVNCTDTKCTFCSKLFTQVRVTPCIKHEPCSTVGYFPHIGRGLWYTVRKHHDTKQVCRLGKVEPKTGELPSLEEYNSIHNPVPSTSSQVVEMAQPITVKPNIQKRLASTASETLNPKRIREKVQLDLPTDTRSWAEQKDDESSSPIYRPESPVFHPPTSLSLQISGQSMEKY